MWFDQKCPRTGPRPPIDRETILYLFNKVEK